MEVRDCLYCKKKLKPLKRTVDWQNRKFHKKCYFEYLVYLDIKQEYEQETGRKIPDRYV